MMFSCWCSQRVSYHAGSVKTILGLSLRLSHSSSAGGVFLFPTQHCMFYGSWTAALTTTCSATFPARGWKGTGGHLSHRGTIGLWRRSPNPTHPYAVLLSVLLPVVSRVTEHQQVGRQPIRAAITALCGNSCDLGALA